MGFASGMQAGTQLGSQMVGAYQGAKERRQQGELNALANQYYQLGTPEERQPMLGQIAAIDPERAAFMQQQQYAQQKQQQEVQKYKQELSGKYANTVLSASEKNRPGIYKALLGKIKKEGILDVSNFPEEYTKELEPMLRSLTSMAGIEQEEYEPLSPEGKKESDIRKGLLSREQAVDRGDPGKGYRWTAEGTLAAIPGGPATKLSETGAKTLALTTEGAKSIDDLEATIEKLGGEITSKTAYSPNIFQTKDQQKFNTLTNDLSDTIGRLRSGGAINVDEMKTFKKLIPKFGDKPETIKYKITRLKGKLKSVASNIQKGKTTGEKQQDVSSMSDEDLLGGF